VTPRHRSARRRRRPSRRRRCRSPIACTFSVDLDANVTPASYAALARPQHLSHPVVLLPVQASPAAVAVAAHRSTTTPRSSWGGGDGDLDHAGVRPAAERRRRTASSSRGRRLRPTSELPADSPAACTFASTLSTSARCASDGRCGAAGGLRQHRYQPARLRASPAGVVAVGSGDVGVAERLSHAHDGHRTLRQRWCATLISDTGSGRLPIALRRGRGDCRRNVRFRTADLRLDGIASGGQSDLFRVSKTPGTAVLGAVLPGRLRP
jgi:hypothetical protein